MNVLGEPAGWSDLVGHMLPTILKATVEAWQSLRNMQTIEREDDITIALCRALRQHRTARGLPFQIHTQQLELGGSTEDGIGRLDIVFNFLVACEDIYFCLEGKRLNVVKDGHRRAYAGEYVRLGMMRFINGQYSRGVRHGGMVGYVFDGDIEGAIRRVESNMRRHRLDLQMTGSEVLTRSTVLVTVEGARESRHLRKSEKGAFQIHHLFMAVN